MLGRVPVTPKFSPLGFHFGTDFLSASFCMQLLRGGPGLPSLTFLSEVEIAKMLIEFSANVLNIFPATPDWDIIPIPTTDTLATLSSVEIDLKFKILELSSKSFFEIGKLVTKSGVFRQLT